MDLEDFMKSDGTITTGTITTGTQNADKHENNIQTFSNTSETHVSEGESSPDQTGVVYPW